MTAGSRHPDQAHSVQPASEWGGARFYLYGTGQEFGPYTLKDLQVMAAGGQLKANARVHSTSGGGWFPAKEIPWLFSDKSWLVASSISFFVGALASTASTSATPASGSPGCSPSVGWGSGRWSTSSSSPSG